MVLGDIKKIAMEINPWELIMKLGWGMDKGGNQKTVKS